ncbi:unnamed protein product [Allacma fusca]|uniref:Gag protein n=1 Tax=Allacma fusca TaxID=39272 RepID=A0A8J2P6H8_9HEXA|nr:unnamed protein product [Allacma fusca]
MTDARKSLRGHKGYLTRCKKFFDSVTPQTATRANHSTYKKALPELQEKIDLAYGELYDDCQDNAEIQALDAEINPILDLVFELRIKLDLWDEELTKKEAAEQAQAAAAAAATPAGTPNPQSTLNQNQSSMKPKLPQLTLPTFTGKYEDWLLFRDRFNQSVHNRADLSGAEKFEYLLAALEGPAADLIESIPLQDTNYPIAYNRLVDTFQHTREIIFRQVDRILDQPEMHSRSASALRSMSNITANSLAAISSLGQVTKSWDAIIIRIITRKLDSTTKLRFNQTLPNKDMPSLQTLLEFLNKEVIDLASAGEMSTASTAKPYEKKQDSYRRDSHPSSSRPKPISMTCDLCKGSHHNYACPKLNETPEKERKRLVEKSQLFGQT